MRATIAKFLIRWVSRWYEASYHAYHRVTEEGFPYWYEKPWTFGARQAGRFVPLAQRIDRQAAVDQMVEEGWWG